MLFAIILGAICFGLLGEAFARVGESNMGRTDRDSVLGIIGVVMTFLGLVLAKIYFDDSTKITSPNNFLTTVAALIILPTMSWGVVRFCKTLDFLSKKPAQIEPSAAKPKPSMPITGYKK